MLATALWERWNNFCLKLSVSFDLFLSGWIKEILSNPLILISSSIISTSWFTSGLQDGISTLKFFLETFVLKPNELSIFLVSFEEIEIPIIFLNLLWSISIDLFFILDLPIIENLLASPPQILIINPVAISKPSFIEN